MESMSVATAERDAMHERLIDDGIMLGRCARVAGGFEAPLTKRITSLDGVAHSPL